MWDMRSTLCLGEVHLHFSGNCASGGRLAREEDFMVKVQGLEELHHWFWAQKLSKEGVWKITKLYNKPYLQA